MDLKQRGFTITELVLVIVLVGLMGAYFIGNKMPSRALPLEAQAQQLAGDIRFTQALSMFQNVRYRANLSASGSYQILDSSGSAITLQSLGSTTATLAHGVSLSASTNYLVFDGQGTPYTSSTAGGAGTKATSDQTITLTTGSQSIVVGITRETGDVTVGGIT